MSDARLRGDRRGLTLIELVLTLTILALAGALVSGALATGLRAWKSGLNSGRDELVARIVLERIATQLRDAVDSPAERNGAAAIAFDAADDRLRFVTLAASGQAPVQVSYGLRVEDGETRLVYGEYPWPDKDFFGEGRPRHEEVVPEVSGLAVTVVKRSRKKDGILEPATGEWSPLDGALPASVGIEIVIGAAGRTEPKRFRITVPILTQRSP